MLFSASIKQKMMPTLKMSLKNYQMKKRADLKKQSLNLREERALRLSPTARMSSRDKTHPERPRRKRVKKPLRRVRNLTCCVIKKKGGEKILCQHKQQESEVQVP